MNTYPATGTGVPDSSPDAQCGGGDEAVDKALHEVAEAKAEELKAEAQLKHAIETEERAEHKLEKAEADLEEAERHTVIHFEVDGDPYETRQKVWTPNAIINAFPKLDPTANYLVRIGHDEGNYKDKGEIPIEIHECDRFQVIPIGPAQVSDGTKRSGIEVFITGLKDLGYDPVPLKNTTDRIFFDYEVPSGKFAGKQFRLGLVVPPDFPLSAPGGLHVSPRIHPNRGGDQVHPVEGIQDSPDFQRGAGGEWHYWSRPYREWGKTKKTVTAYMSHIFRLWDTQ